MDSKSRKIETAAQVEGEESQWFIKCDLDESKGKPIAVLFWPGSDGRGVWYQLNPAELSLSTDEGVAFIHTGKPLHIPRVLADMNPAPLTDDAFRLGFFRVE